MRRATRKALRKFSRSRLNSDRDCYCELRKQYKHLLLTKEKEYKLKCRKELESYIGDPKQFWRNIKKFTTKPRQVSDISDEQWLEHFESVRRQRYGTKLMMKCLHTPQNVTGIVVQKTTL